MEFSGRYINMAASVERRVQMEEQFARLGCAALYQRFDAVDGRSLVDAQTSLSPAELGCYMSHYHCITAGGPADKHVHVVEDDVVFAAQSVSLLSQVPEEVMEQCDILFTDIFVPLNAQAIFNLIEYYRPTGMIAARQLPPDQRYPSCLMFANIRTIDFGGCTSYVVNKNSRHKLRRLLDQRMNFGVAEPIDMAIRKMANAGEVTAYCVLPFLTSIRPDSIYKTTMVERGQDKSTEMAFFLLRNYFFVGKDEDYMRAAGEELAAKLDDPGFMDTILSVFRFMFSEKFVQF
jgi:GR25 family glycosyltransferase involved in LPS biosynthesis